MPSPGSRRLLRRGLVAVAVLLLALGGTVAFLELHSPGNVSHPNLSFTRSTTTTPPPTRPTPVPIFEWPRYGFDAARTRLFAAGNRLDPPLRRGWTFNDFGLLEFPPVIFQSQLFVIDDNGSAKAINRLTGQKMWENKLGTLAAGSPAIGVYASQRLVFFPLLSTNPNAGQNPGNGRFAALSMSTGQVVWSMPIPPGTESSPLVWGPTVYFGDQNGTVYSVRAADGHVNWTYHASGAVKGGPTLSDGLLYFGDYDGRAYALNATTGHEVWAVSTSGTHFGFGSGNFYSTPAVAFGRVYMGNTDGRVYSFAARTGQLAWATSTGAYVYSSAAVEDVPGLGPTVYIGSYDGRLYAFNAQSGSVRWSHNTGGVISGSPTIVGNVVYFSNLRARTTIGLDLRSGNEVFSFPDGAFNPVIADPTTIYLNGYSTLYQLLPARPTAQPAKKRAAVAGAASGQRGRNK
jgi:outer membrane protein assembly factor BamB